MNILLIRLRLVGDVVFTTPAIRAVRRRFPDAHLTYLVEAGASPIVLSNPHLDDVIVVPRTTGLRRITDDVRLARRLRRARFDLVIDFHGGPRGSWLAWATGAPRRIGYEIAGRSWMYTEVIPRPRELRRRHSVENQWDLLTPLDMAPPDRDRDAAEMPEDDAARLRVEARLTAAGVTRDDRLIVLHVSAGNPFRRWPLPAFAEVAAALALADPRHRVVLTSGPSESEAADLVASAAAERAADAAARVLRCGEFTLTELRVLVGRAVLFIGGDSGPLHLASTTSTPIVGIFGPTLPERSAPWRPARHVFEAVEPGALDCRPCNQRVCAPGDFRCLTATSPQRVIAAALRALERAASRHAPLAAGAR
jgi:lipopolysaccharide heptosyltransferase II